MCVLCVQEPSEPAKELTDKEKEQIDNEKAAAIITNLLRESDEARRRADDLAASLRQAEESFRRDMAERTSAYESTISDLRRVAKREQTAQR